MTLHCSTWKLSRSCLSWQHPAGSLCREVLEHVHYWFSALRRLPFHSTSFRKCIGELELRSPAYQSLNSTGMIQKAGPRLRNRGSWLPLAMGASSRNLGPIFLTKPVAVLTHSSTSNRSILFHIKYHRFPSTSPVKL